MFVFYWLRHLACHQTEGLKTIAQSFVLVTAKSLSRLKQF